MDGADSGQDTISVLIKTPNQVREDLVLEGVHLSWTVGDLKTRLSAVYATRPAAKDQRLIYSGKQLPDHLRIRDVFRQSDRMPAVHLVCAFRNPPREQLGQTPKSSEQAPPSSPRPAAAPAPSTPSSSSAVRTPSSPELRQRRTTTSSPSAAPPAHTQTPAPHPWGPTWPPAAMPGAPQITQPMFPTYSLYSPQQLLWLQHVYARQYYMQYHAALVAAGSAPSPPASVTGQFPPVPAHQVPVPAPLANQNPIDPLPANPNPARDGAFMNPGDQVNQDMRMNAQGGAVMEDEDAIERDWLDWLYSAARFCVLLMIVYFNSNLSRFLMVMSTLLLMYLHTAGLFPFRRRQVPAPDHLQPPEVQHNQQNENRIPNPNPEDDRDEAAADGPDGPGPMAAVLVPPHRVSVMWTAWVFFKTFFSSLIPEAPGGVAN